MKILSLILFLVPALCTAQIFDEETLLSRLKSGGTIGPDAVAKRSAVLYSQTFTTKEIDNIHENLIRAGIDAVAYFKIDGVVAGPDVARSHAEYFVKREITNLIIIRKSTSGFSVYVTLFNGKDDFVNPDQPTWTDQSTSLNDLMNSVYRNALSSNKKKNLLINDVPETDLPVKIIDGIRNENFPYDLKIDRLAVPRFNDATPDTALAGLFKMYPYKFQFTNPTTPDKELRDKGFLYVVCFVYTRSSIARELLGYPVSKSESAFISVTYPNGQIQLKTIPADTPVFKFYIRHIDTGNVFLGTKWDAETTWQQALQNYIKGFKVEMKVN